MLNFLQLNIFSRELKAVIATACLLLISETFIKEKLKPKDKLTTGTNSSKRACILCVNAAEQLH